MAGIAARFAGGGGAVDWLVIHCAVPERMGLMGRLGPMGYIGPLGPISLLQVFALASFLFLCSGGRIVFTRRDCGEWQIVKIEDHFFELSAQVAANVA